MFPDSDEVLAKFMGVKPPCCQEMKRSVPISMVFLAFCSVNFHQDRYFTLMTGALINDLVKDYCHLILQLTNTPISSTLKAKEGKKMFLL